MTDSPGQAVATPSPRAWLDGNHVPCFRADVPLEEASELQDMLGEAFNAGVLSGYEQAIPQGQQSFARFLWSSVGVLCGFGTVLTIIGPAPTWAPAVLGVCASWSFLAAVKT